MTKISGCWAMVKSPCTITRPLSHAYSAVMTPTLAFLPEVALALARSKDARRAPAADVLAAYRAALALGPDAQRDPFTDAARRRVAMLAR